MAQALPDFALERDLIARGHIRIAGVDEVGRGPWAGPVVAAAVVLNPALIPFGLNDSKKLRPNARERIALEVLAHAEVGFGEASVAEIDRLNILRASHLAMIRALYALPSPPDMVLIDGNMLPRDLPWPGRAVVGGDSRSLSIAAASVVAKVTRDRVMVALGQQHPGYGWDTNAGYGTERHSEGLAQFGVTPHHRRSFKPIHKMLYQED